ncbi:MAG: hypothetical protein QXF52_04995 [Thermoproteota archaeon]
MNPELRKCFIDSIEYLRKMDFFQDYSNLTSEKILDKILSREMDYETQWFVEKWPEEEQRKGRKEGRTHGQILKEWIEESREHEEYWMKASSFEVDLKMASFDIKRVFVEDPETVIEEGMCKMLLKKLSRISRGVFNPSYIKEEILEWRGNPPPALKAVLGEWCHHVGCIFKVYFEFKGKEQMAEFYSDGDFLYMDPAIKMMNELIKDTGYQYYHIYDLDYITYAVFSNDEAEKMTKRGWKIYLP